MAVNSNTASLAKDSILKVEDPGNPGTFLTLDQGTSLSIERTASTDQYATIGNADDKFAGGNIGKTASIELVRDVQDAAGQALLAPNSAVNVEWFPEGDVPGEKKFEFCLLIDGVSDGVSAGEKLTHSVTTKIAAEDESVIV